MKKVTIWVDRNETGIPADLIPGSVADAFFPRPLRDQAAANQVLADQIADVAAASETFPLGLKIVPEQIDLDAGKRLLEERKQVRKLKAAFQNMPEDYSFSMSAAQSYLAGLGLDLEVRRFGEEPPAKTRNNKTRAILKSFIDDNVGPNIEAIWLHIRNNAGKENFPYSGASKDVAIHEDGESTTKVKMERALHSLLKVL